MFFNFLSVRFLLSKLLIVAAAIMIESALAELFFGSMPPIFGIFIGIGIWLLLFVAFFKKLIGGFFGFLLAETSGFVAGLLVWRGLNEMFFMDLDPIIKLIGGFFVLIVIFFFELRIKK